ncbi:MAG: hypothetical protein FJX73_10320 [Armatimonadetes bacterium]|nr:hypothetical protein [Armatimonadota bacterium]
MPAQGQGPAGVLRGQAGTTLVEMLVAILVMAIVIGTMSVLVGAAVRGKMIVAVRTADTESARQTLEWMSERLRNAGLNVYPNAQVELRCRDMVVAEDSGLRPRSGSVHVSGEILNSDLVAGNEVITLGYRLENGVVVEEMAPCSVAWNSSTVSSSAVSNPRIPVTSLVFRYFARTGDLIPVPSGGQITDPEQVRGIRLIEVTLTVQGEEGTSGAQTQTFTRLVMLRNPRPDVNNWISPSETNPP